MIIGNENVGKTTLKKRLIESSKAEKVKIDKKNEESMTHGVDIESWKDEENNIFFSIWDFAGHEE